MDASTEQQAMMYIDQGYSCTESVLKAAGDVYGLTNEDEITSMCSVLSNGMGIGCFCGAVLVGLMILGRMFDPVTAKRLRIRLLWGFNERFPDFNCHALKRSIGAGDGCTEAILHVCRLIDALVAEESG